MKYTSAQANKLLRQLQEERTAVLRSETQSRTFVAATVEDVEAARPAYDYAATQAKLQALEEKIRRVKHAVNAFNLSHKVEGFDMTVERKNKLGAMGSVLEKTRLSNAGRSSIIEYEYANYDLERVKADYTAVTAELGRAQLALDKLNNTEAMEIDL